MGIHNMVVDASSIEVNRRQRRAKTDRMDVKKLVRQLVRYWRGERDVWSVVRVPSAEAEDSRQPHRELEVLKEERKRHRVRIQSLLFTQGIDVKVGPKFLEKLAQLRCWNQEPIPVQMKQRIQDEYDRLQLVAAQIREVKAKQAEQLEAEQNNLALEKVRKLQQLMAIGMGSSWIFVMELFGWRQFQNRREVAAAVGLTPTPYNSGDSAREQGISRGGNWRARKVLIPDLVDGVASSNWLPDASARMLHQVFRSIPGTDRRWAASVPPLQQPGQPMKMVARLNDLKGCRFAATSIE